MTFSLSLGLAGEKTFAAHRLYGYYGGVACRTLRLLSRDLLWFFWGGIARAPLAGRAGAQRRFSPPPPGRRQVLFSFRTPPNGGAVSFFEAFSMLYVFAAICIALMILSLMLIVFGLPGNWVILILTALWAFFTDAPGFSLQVFALLAGMAVLGELVEFAAGYYGVKRFGGSSKGSVGGMIGALVGAVLCAPLFFGFGALLGALAGGFTGCFLVEKGAGTATNTAARAAFGATLGRFGGFVVKLGIGVGMIWLTAPRIWGSI